VTPLKESYVEWMGACCQAAGIFPEWRDLWSMLITVKQEGYCWCDLLAAKSAIVWNSQEKPQYFILQNWYYELSLAVRSKVDNSKIPSIDPKKCL